MGALGFSGLTGRKSFAGSQDPDFTRNPQFKECCFLYHEPESLNPNLRVFAATENGQEDLLKLLGFTFRRFPAWGPAGFMVL